jgi:predicted DsbA family dithiol-disulfide isomerase
MMELTLLTVPACPSAALFEERLAAALAGHPDVVVQRREIADEREAAEAGMRGSPTLLIDGVDPFAAPGQLPSLSCRLYRDPTGHADGAPPLDALQEVLEQASAHR